MTTFNLVIVGRYKSEKSADRAACLSGERHGGIVQGMRGLLGLYAKPVRSRSDPSAPRRASNANITAPCAQEVSNEQ